MILAYSQTLTGPGSCMPQSFNEEAASLTIFGKEELGLPFPVELYAVYSN